MKAVMKMIRGRRQLSSVPINSQLTARGGGVEVVVRDKIFYNNYLNNDENYSQEILFTTLK